MRNGGKGREEGAGADAGEDLGVEGKWFVGAEGAALGLQRRLACFHRLQVLRIRTV